MLTIRHWCDMLQITAFEIAYSNWFRQTNEDGKYSMSLNELSIFLCRYTYGEVFSIFKWISAIMLAATIYIHSNQLSYSAVS